eukprot:CAMPEP_0170414770 /NCGR_PEP_ID=MMETSP0117_2-20130122/32251_1 /TAXON_ID=400756 /ORGANISM="Durinskia baltica, Strain CSIRO CS-38" /LENGTH=116 /DNA_ID=CAMNT_0010672693 /DNA_START=46 /DNA_END=393 /DNA_ORIENTATION=+
MPYNDLLEPIAFTGLKVYRSAATDMQDSCRYLGLPKACENGAVGGIDGTTREATCESLRRLAIGEAPKEPVEVPDVGAEVYERAIPIRGDVPGAAGNPRNEFRALQDLATSTYNHG